MQKISHSIATFEGFYKPGSRAQRNNNPGNLRRAGDNGIDDNRYGRYSDASLGWAALNNDVRAKITGRTRTGLRPDSTLYQFFSVYAPQTENPTVAYTRFVARQLGIMSSTRFNEWVEV